VNIYTLFLSLNSKLTAHYLLAQSPSAVRQADACVAFIRRHIGLYTDDAYAAYDANPGIGTDPDRVAPAATLDDLRARLSGASGDDLPGGVVGVYIECAAAALCDYATGSNAFALAFA
jgi:hypothetical protein